jgi:Flp pilus assembly CpaE family ATPase
MWSASRIQHYLGDAGGKEKFHLVLNRFRKIPGFSESDAETASGMRVLWKIPNHYFAVSSAIDRGVPVMSHSSTEIARAFSGLAARLTEDDIEVKRKAWSLFKSV